MQQNDLLTMFKDQIYFGHNIFVNFHSYFKGRIHLKYTTKIIHYLSGGRASVSQFQESFSNGVTQF